MANVSRIRTLPCGELHRGVALDDLDSLMHVHTHTQ